MKQIITSERQYTSSFYRLASKDTLGFNVQVSGDKKVKVMKEARELLAQAVKDAKEVESEDTTES